jgi:hypothetical protein
VHPPPPTHTHTHTHTHARAHQVRIWKVVRSQEEIISHMRWATGLENHRDLVAYWKFNDPDNDSGQFRRVCACTRARACVAGCGRRQARVAVCVCVCGRAGLGACGRAACGASGLVPPHTPCATQHNTLAHPRKPHTHTHTHTRTHTHTHTHARTRRRHLVAKDSSGKGNDLSLLSSPLRTGAWRGVARGTRPGLCTLRFRACAWCMAARAPCGRCAVVVLLSRGASLTSPPPPTHTPTHPPTPHKSTSTDGEIHANGNSLRTGLLTFKNNVAVNKAVKGMPEKDFTVEFWAKSSRLDSKRPEIQVGWLGGWLVGGLAGWGFGWLGVWLVGGLVACGLATGGPDPSIASHANHNTLAPNPPPTHTPRHTHARNTARSKSLRSCSAMPRSTRATSTAGPTSWTMPSALRGERVAARVHVCACACSSVHVHVSSVHVSSVHVHVHVHVQVYDE